MAEAACGDAGRTVRFRLGVGTLLQGSTPGATGCRGAARASGARPRADPADPAPRLSGPLALLWVGSRWPALKRELVGARGYIAHRLWFAWPWTIGVTTWWQDEAAAYRSAHMPQHQRFWAWAAETGRTRGGWLAHYRYVRGGPLWGQRREVVGDAFCRSCPFAIRRASPSGR
jgi:hypothetical protein